MTVLLALVGALALFGLGVWVGRRGRRRDDVAPAPQADDAEADGFDLVERHRDGFVVADSSGRIVHRNAAARELQGTHVGLLVDEAIDRHVALARRDGTSDEVLEMYGPPKVVLVVEALALRGGGVVVYIEDVSERRRIDQVRTDFVANISHELKTPVGAMSVLAETLEHETDSEVVGRIVDRMVGEAERATRTIDDLMELSRIELGGEREVEPVRVDAVVAAAIDRVVELAARRRIELVNLVTREVVGDVICDVAMFGDRRQLTSAVGNLVENAVKYSEPGGRVEILARVGEGDVEVTVVDEGVGIPQRDLDRIFERFYRVDRARSRETGGTGLGLSIVRHVATNHGGEVWVRSAEGEGSAFTLRLPVGRRPGVEGGEPVTGPIGRAGTGADAESHAESHIEPHIEPHIPTDIGTDVAPGAGKEIA